MANDMPTLATLIGLERLQTMQDNITQISKAAVVYFDPSGNMITKAATPAVRIGNACIRMLDNEFLRNESKTLCARCRESKKPERCYGETHNLAISAVPVFYEDIFLGAWVVCCNLEADENGIVNNGAEMDTALSFLMAVTKEMIQLAKDKRFTEAENEKLSSHSDWMQNTLEALQTSFDTAEVSIYVTDFYTGELIMCNTRYAQYFGLTPDELVGTYCYENLGFAFRCPFCPYDKLIGTDEELLSPYTWENYFELLGCWLQSSNRAARWVDGRLVHIATAIDITQRKKLEEEVHILAYQDHVLELPNTISLERDVESMAGDSQLIVADIEGLRKVNDVYGRVCGDLLLLAVRDYIQSMAVPHAALYRLKIADFGMLVQRAGYSRITEIVKELHKRCEQPWPVSMEGQIHDIFIAVNICVVPVTGGDVDAINNIYGSIEHTLEIARNTGGIAMYDDDTEDQLRLRSKSEISLKKCVREGMAGFYVVFQPIIDPGTARWSGLEALCRWNSPDVGPVSPLDFIPIAESIGLIGKIGLWVLEKSIQQVKSWALDQAENFLLEVNLSPVQLTIPGLGRHIVEILKKYAYPPGKLCLAVTESNELNFAKHTLDAFEQLNKIGVKIALDDFGTGYSSLNSLHKLPVDFIKTDRSFIMGLESDIYLQRLFYIMVELAHVADKKIVAEGVETEFQAQFLLKNGTDFFQGNLFSKPLAAEEMQKNLHKFHTPSSELVSVGYSKFDMAQLTAVEGNYSLPPTLYKVMNRCMHVLFTNQDGNKAIDTVLGIVGKELKVSRAYVFVKDAEGFYSNTNEWCAEGITPEIDNLQKAASDELTPEWMNVLRSEGLLVAADIRTLEPAVFKILDAQGIQSVAEFPIWRDNKLFGFVGFDDCESMHSWSKDELQMLHTLTGIITSTLWKMNLQDKVNAQTLLLENVLKNMNTQIYASDLETNEIIFVNAKMAESFGDRPLVGQICWAALQDKTERCEFCPIPYLLAHPGESCEWEYYNEILGKHFKIRDCIIPWTGDKLVHLEYADDITELKKHQKKLEQYASTDVLTSALNRSSFSNALWDMLIDAQENGFVVTVIFADIDGLKIQNDTYGHSVGDQLINSVVLALRANIRDSDIIGRYGGDEFIIAMPRCQKLYAEKRMEQSLANLDKIKFSYGIVESNELPFCDGQTYMQKLIEIADGRMFEQKRMKKGIKPFPQSLL